MGIFNSVPLPKIKRSRHNLSFNNCFSAQFGKVYPVMSRKVVPGDRFKFQSQMFAQFSPMATKVYQDFVCRQSFFFVPTRLLWDDFEDFYSVNETEQYIHPYFDYVEIVRTGLARHGSFFDYFNLPTFYYPSDFADVDFSDWEKYAGMQWNGHFDDMQRIWNIVNGGQVNRQFYHLDALKIIAFEKIYSDWFADENLQLDQFNWKDIHQAIEDIIQAQNGNLTSYIVRMAYRWSQGYYNKSYPKDYFTGSLPFAQKGPQVNVPFTGEGYVRFWRHQTSHISTSALYTTILSPEQINPNNPSEKRVAFTGSNQNSPINNDVVFQNGVTSLEDLRSAMMLQQFYERNARSGTRYKETILAHFGVLTPDARLDRSQFIQDISTPVNISNVYSTSANSDGSGITGEPVSTVNSAGYSKNRKFFFDEHGYVLSLWVCYPRAAYYKGVEREWFELDKFDYFWPDFQHLGEQEVYVGEVSMGNKNPLLDTQQADNETFGYNPRYSQYKVALNQIHGDFRDSCKAMSDARDFPSGISLSDRFIRIDPTVNNLDRIFNYVDTDYDKIDVSLLSVLMLAVRCPTLVFLVFCRSLTIIRYEV